MITRDVAISYSKEYETLEEAINDEDNFLREIIVGNGQLQENELTAEDGSYLNSQQNEEDKE